MEPIHPSPWGQDGPSQPALYPAGAAVSARGVAAVEGLLGAIADTRAGWPAAEADALLKTILNWVPEGIAVVGGPPDFRIRMVSRFAGAALQRSAAEIVGLSTANHQVELRIFLPDGKTVPRSEQMPSYRATRFGEEVHNCELAIFSRDGRRFDALVDALPIRDQARNVVGAITCWRDVTAVTAVKRSLECGMAELQQLLEERTRELNAACANLRSEVDRTQLLENRLVAMLENEQRRIGQDLHDNIGSQLSGIEMLCEAMMRQGDRSSGRRGVRTMARLLRGAMEDTRRIAHSMAPVPWCPQGLALSLRALARRTRTTAGCRCTVRNYGAEVADPSVALHLYRIAQEAIANAARHGEAHRIAITLHNGTGVRLLIRDDGHGMPENTSGRLGLGIATMRIRARAIGGSLSVCRNESGGTDVVCSVPPRATLAQPPHQP